MACLFMDSGETAFTRTRKWDAESPDAPPAGPLSACGAFVDDYGYSPALDENYGAGGPGSYLQKNLATNKQTIFLGAYVNVRNAGTNWFPIFTIRDGATTQGQIIALPDGSIGFFRGHAYTGTLVQQTVAGLLSINLWPYVAAKYKVDGTVGEVVIEVDGTQVLSFTGNTQTSANAYATNWWIGGRPPAVLDPAIDVGIYISHIWCNDDSGTKNNSIPEPRRILCRYLAAVGVSDTYTASAGTTVDCVKEKFPDDDGTTISSDASGDKSLFTFDPVAAFEADIHAVAVCVQDKLASAGTTTARQILRIAATEYAGTAYAPTTSYLDHQGIFEQDITLAELNSAQAGIEAVVDDTDHVVTKIAVEIACDPVFNKSLIGGPDGVVLIPSSEIIQSPALHWQDDPRWEYIKEYPLTSNYFQYGGGCEAPGCVAWINGDQIGSHWPANQKARFRVGPGDYPGLVPGLTLRLVGIIKWDYFASALDLNTHPLRIWVAVNDIKLVNLPSGFPPGNVDPLPFSLDVTADVNGELIIDYGIFRDHGIGSLSLNANLISLEVVYRGVSHSYGYIMQHHA